MSTISEVMAGTQTAQTQQTGEAAGTSKKFTVGGRTIGNPRLSETAAKYYEELKKKYSNMDFVLVSSDMKAFAQAHAGSFANPYKLAVLIDEEKIERMATDENFRRQYEAILDSAAGQVSQLAQKLTATGANVKGYGMQVDDGGNASFFAVIDKSLEQQRERIEKKAAEKKEEKRAEEKKAQREAEKERLQNRKPEREDEVVISASSMEELIQKVNDWVLADRSNRVWTEYERGLGQSVDYSV